MTDRELMQQALEDAYLAGFNASGEGYNGEYPFQDRNRLPTNDENWLRNRAEDLAPLRERLAQPEPQAPRPDYRDWDYQDQLDEQEKSAQSPLDRMAENARELGLDYEPVQEPVAWLYRDSWGTMKLSQIMPPPVGAFPVYTTPPRREWVGLTDEEIEQVCVPLGAAMLSFPEVARAIEAKLKEKNS